MTVESLDRYEGLTLYYSIREYLIIDYYRQLTLNLNNATQ